MSSATRVAQSKQPQPAQPQPAQPAAASPGRAGVPERVPADYSSYRVVAAKHPWRWVGTAVVALGVLAVAWSLATNPRWEWGVVAQWFTAQSVVYGLVETLKLTAISGVPNLRKFDEWFGPTNRLRVRGTDYLIEAARAAGTRRIVAQSYAGWP